MFMRLLVDGDAERGAECKRTVKRFYSLGFKSVFHGFARILSISKEDITVLLKKNGILHTGVSSIANRSLQNVNLLGFPNAEHRHAVDTACRIVLGRAANRIRCSDNKRHINLSKVVVDFLHFEDDVVLRTKRKLLVSHETLQYVLLSQHFLLTHRELQLRQEAH